MTGLTMDAGGLIAVEQRDRRVRVLLEEAERAGWTVAVPVGPLARVWRSALRPHRTSDVVDASMVLCARGRGHRVLTSDPGDLAALDAGLPQIVV